METKQSNARIIGTCVLFAVVFIVGVAILTAYDNHVGKERQRQEIIDRFWKN